MKIEINEQKKYLIKLLVLMFVCEIMISFNNRIIQIIGICILPFIFVNGFLLFKTDNKKKNQ